MLIILYNGITTFNVRKLMFVKIYIF